MTFHRDNYEPVAKPPARAKRKPFQRREDRPGRLPIDRFASLPLSPASRDHGPLEKRYVCEFCGLREGKDVFIQNHHIKSRGAFGGNDGANISGLCSGWKSNHCHTKFHGGQISRSALLEKLGRIK